MNIKMIDYIECETPIGKMCLVSAPLGPEGSAGAQEIALSGAWFVGQKHLPRVSEGLSDPNYASYWREVRRKDNAVLALAADELARYFAGEKFRFSVPMNPGGAGLKDLFPAIPTPFQLKVWSVISEVEWGKTITYGGIAKSFKLPRGTHTAPRAVGKAVGSNPLVVFIPCHRVVAADGSSVGYAGGMARKEFLMELEGHKPIELSKTPGRGYGINSTYVPS
ncbi:MAG: methylated-DNA--[protein]-cysteine S-methyltransferase [Synergistaceae bacterium]|jgi:methylated-DNA-[protein]-cysteine S-methyltransferase|nr:methylated-DNA--[protein]-cysteine S-methyltransferase [Synergistaceae bacterium]